MTYAGPTTRIFLPLLLAALLAQLATAQPTFDVDAYKHFLEQTSTIDAKGLLERYQAGWFRKSAPMKFGDALFADSIDHYYDLTAHERSLIDMHGFMVTERVAPHSFGHAYLEIYMRDLPVYVSSDAILHALHMSYDALLVELELSMLRPRLADLLMKLHDQVPALRQRYDGVMEMDQPLRDLDLYLLMARRLLADVKYPVPLPVEPHFIENGANADSLKVMIEAQMPNAVPLFSKVPRLIDFSQFTPRGHYTQSQELTAYFKAMIWLGRTELQLAAPKAANQQPSEEDIHRQTLLTLLVAESFELGNADADYEAIDQIIGSMVGEQDNLTLKSLRMLMAETGVQRAGDLVEKERWKSFQKVVMGKSYAIQRINSQILISGGTMETRIEPAVAFFLLGQRFIVDSYVLGQVVYDKVEHQGGLVRRMLPSTLDVLFALGNNAAGQLLQPELTQYHYAPNIAALRYLIEGYEPQFWTSTFYNGWLDAIRTLNPPGDRSRLPEFMQTAAWWQKEMNTQLASWAQLRHDNLLYAKQSYTAGATCSYPKSLVEPIPEFYDAIGRLAENGTRIIESISFNKPAAKERVLGYFEHMKKTSATLGGIARKELVSEPLSSEEEMFLKKMLYNVPEGCTEVMEGWYPRLFYKPDDVEVMDMVVADVHTAPTDAEGNPVGWVLHGGTGPLNMAVVTCRMADGTPVAYIGPVMSYYEHVSANFKRLTDEEWKEGHALAPSFRPAFVNLYLAGAAGESRGEAQSLTTGVDYTNGGERGSSIRLAPAAPNPFTATTLIGFSIPESLASSDADLTIFDAAGEPVRGLLHTKLPAGNYTVRWDGTAGDGSTVAAGTYFYRVTIGGEQATGQITFVGRGR